MDSNFYSHMRINVGRRPSGRINFCLRIDKQLYERLKEISEATGVSIADLLEQKIIELIALFSQSSFHRMSGPGGTRTLDLRLVRAAS